MCALVILFVPPMKQQKSTINSEINFQEHFPFGINYIDYLIKNLKNKFWIDLLRASSELKYTQKTAHKNLFYQALFSIGKSLLIRLKLVQ